jgi:hypothetical protein
MFRTMTTLAALAIFAGSAAAAPMLDAHGKCRDNGKFVSASHCQAMAPGAMPAQASSASAMRTSGAATSPTMPGAHPQCKKGKVCGDSCIAMNKVCHK